MIVETICCSDSCAAAGAGAFVETELVPVGVIVETICWLVGCTFNVVELVSSFARTTKVVATATMATTAIATATTM